MNNLADPAKTKPILPGLKRQLLPREMTKSISLGLPNLLIYAFTHLLVNASAARNPADPAETKPISPCFKRQLSRIYSSTHLLVNPSAPGPRSSQRSLPLRGLRIQPSFLHPFLPNQPKKSCACHKHRHSKTLAIINIHSRLATIAMSPAVSSQWADCTASTYRIRPQAPSPDNHGQRIATPPLQQDDKLRSSSRRCLPLRGLARKRYPIFPLVG